jgi:hypothetical protein
MYRMLGSALHEAGRVPLTWLPDRSLHKQQGMRMARADTSSAVSCQHAHYRQGATSGRTSKVVCGTTLRKKQKCNSCYVLLQSHACRPLVCRVDNQDVGPTSEGPHKHSPSR